MKEIIISTLLFCGVFTLIYIGLEVMNRKKTQDDEQKTQDEASREPEDAE